MKPALGLLALFAPLLFLAESAHAQKTLPIPPPPFQGKIEVKASDSTPRFPPQVTPPAGAPNILLVMLDDVGFAAASTFGGLVNTPTLDKLSKSGLVYTHFHTTAMCSPTRAALLTGRNHHVAHTGTVVDWATGYPGYDMLMGRDTVTFAEVLGQQGYATSWFGKNHNVPDWQSSQSGPFELWPTKLGFDYFYGFICGDTNQWRPNLFEGTKPIRPYIGNPGYNLDMDLADQAINWIRLQHAMAPTKPFVVYYVPGATHAPHHPIEYYAHKYAGQFEMGWNEARNLIFENQKRMGIIPQDTLLTQTPSSIPAWESYPEDARKVFSRMMEIYAGYLEQTDANVGRVIDAIEETGRLDNTLIIYICGDNGASAEGTFQGLLNEMSIANQIPEPLSYLIAHQADLGTTRSYNHFPVGWSHAMCTPFQWEKQVASHFGGTRNGMVISWPARIKARHQFRTQFHHVVDIAPTLFEAVGIDAPTQVNGVKQKPYDGVSMVYTFDNPAAPSTRKTQYFEMVGNRAIYSEGWVACTTPALPPWAAGTADVIDDYPWELYDLASDFSQARNLAAGNPGKLRQLQRLFDKEARKYNVYPLDNTRMARMHSPGRPSLTASRSSFTYYPGMIRIPDGASPDVKNKSWSVTAELSTDGHDSGVIVTQGGLWGGWALYMRDGRPVFHYNLVNRIHTTIAGDQLTSGDHVLVFDFMMTGTTAGAGGVGTLIVDGAEVTHDEITSTTPVEYTLDEGMDIGEDSGTPVCLDYDVPFRFTGGLEKVTIDLKLDQPTIGAEEQKKVDRIRHAMRLRD